MANSAQARKRARQAVVRRARNVSSRSSLRTAIKKVINAVAAGDKESASSAYQAVVPFIDKMARKGLIHANKAARHKNRLNASIRAI